MRTFDRKGLEEFLDAGEGDPPPVFAGREDVIAAVERAGRLAWKGEGALSHGRGKATIVIQGAPGAGKSSVLAEIRARLQKAGGKDAAPRFISLDSSSVMTDLQHTVAEIGLAAKSSAEDWFALAANALERINAVSAFGASIGIDRTAPGDPRHLGMLMRKLPPARWEAPVIVAVDEAQNLTADKRRQHALFLQEIHNAARELPLTLVLAGLGDTAEVAEGCGLTRGLGIHDIGALYADDVTFLLGGFCDRFGLRSERCEERLEEFARPCEGWPRHLHFALEALSREAIGTDGDLRRIDWRRAERRAEESRLSYYRRQASPLLEAKGLAAAVMAAFEPGMDRGDVLGLIEESERDKNGFRIPDGMDRARFLQFLTHRGALQMTETGAMVSPIPSFRGFLIRAGGGEAPSALLPPRLIYDVEIRTARREIREHEDSTVRRARAGESLRAEIRKAERRIGELRAELDGSGFFAFRRKAELKREIEAAAAGAEEARRGLESLPEIPPLPEGIRERAALTLTADRWRAAAEKRRPAIAEAEPSPALPAPDAAPRGDTERRRNGGGPSPM